LKSVYRILKTGISPNRQSVAITCQGKYIIV